MQGSMIRYQTLQALLEGLGLEAQTSSQIIERDQKWTQKDQTLRNNLFRAPHVGIFPQIHRVLATLVKECRPSPLDILVLALRSWSGVARPSSFRHGELNNELIQATDLQNGLIQKCLQVGVLILYACLLFVMCVARTVLLHICVFLGGRMQFCYLFASIARIPTAVSNSFALLTCIASLPLHLGCSSYCFLLTFTAF